MMYTYSLISLLTVSLYDIYDNPLIIQYKNQGPRAPNSRKCESYNVNDWRSKFVGRVTFWRDMYVGDGTRCALGM